MSIRKKLWKPVSTAVLLICTMAIAGCQKRSQSLKIALAVPITGDIAAMGQGMKRGAELAIAQANAQKLFSVPVELVAFDDRADPKEAVNVANQIISDPNIFAVIGHLNSGCAIPAARIYARHSYLMISPAATNPKLTLQQLEDSWQSPRSIFRVNTTDDVQGQSAAHFVKKRLKARTAAIIHDKTPYGQGLAEEFRKEWEILEGKTISFDGIAIGEKDFKALLTRIQSTHPDVLYFGGIYNEGGLIARQAKEIGLKAKFVSGDAMQTPEFIRIAGESADGSFVTNVGIPPEQIPSAQEFLVQYRQAYPNVDMQPYDHYTYEATRIALLALAQTPRQADGAYDRTAAINFVQAIDYNGVLGRTSFDEKGDTTNKTISTYRVDKGNFIPVR